MHKLIKIKALLSVFIIFNITSLFASSISHSGNKSYDKDGPKVVNIVNFIRLLEPRDPEITEDVLYQTVVKQVEIMRKYNLPGTFLLQYDALMDSRYQKLLRSLPANSFEIGRWWELPQPLIKKAGINGEAGIPGTGMPMLVLRLVIPLLSGKRLQMYIWQILKRFSVTIQSLWPVGLLMPTH